MNRHVENIYQCLGFVEPKRKYLDWVDKKSSRLGCRHCGTYAEFSEANLRTVLELKNRHSKYKRAERLVAAVTREPGQKKRVSLLRDCCGAESGWASFTNSEVKKIGYGDFELGARKIARAARERPDGNAGKRRWFTRQIYHQN